MLFSHHRFPISYRPRMALLALLVLLVALPAAAQYSTGFGKNKIQYRDFEWKIYHSPHFDVYYYIEDAGLLQKVISFAESAYDELSREFDFQIQEPTTLIFYETHSAFQQNNIISNFIPEGTGAFATPVRNRMVLPVDLPDPELLALIKHELTHIFEYHILFQGSLTKGLTSTPPLWFMEGLASYMAKDEESYDKMYLRDAVVNDSIPSITQSGVGGFFAYRFGHAAFDFIEERWGRDGLLDFLYEFRNTLGSRVGRAVERTFKMDPEDFDREFRRWLRQKYLPELVATGEPGDFGRPFRIENAPQGQKISPVASPSGDLVASYAIYRGDIDVVLFDARKRRFLRNLTKGFPDVGEYQYFVGQFLNVRRDMGSDLGFAPDGNTIAVFAKREKGRSLLLVDVLEGGVRKIIDLDIEQPLNPTFSPDGRSLVFSGNRGGKFDLFRLDLESLEIVNLTDDDIYHGSPAFSPDGRWLVFSSVVDEYAKLFRMDLSDPARPRYQLTRGESNDTDAVFSPAGKRVYYTSDATGVNNIYSLDLESGEQRQYTDVVTGCFMPAVLAGRDGDEQLVYTGYWKGQFDLFVTDVDEPVSEPVTVEIPPEPLLAGSLPAFEPDIQVAIDDANKEGYKGLKFFLENADTFIGVDDDQNFIGQLVLSFSDLLGDRRIIGVFSSVESFSNFDAIYLDQSDRLQWRVHLFDDRDFYLGQTFQGDLERSRQRYQLTGGIASLIYPINFSHRFEVGAGYILRKFSVPIGIDPITGRLFFREIDEDFPIAQAALVGDTASYASYGPITGRRWSLDFAYAPDLDDSGTLFTSVSLDARQYIPVTLRSNLALRLFAGMSDGNSPSVYYFGGLDTLRGFRFREFVGDRAFFANIEYRFPLVDFIATPIFNFQGVRGRVFLDIGGAWFDELEDFDFWDDENNRLEDAVASYGWGFTVRFFGLNLNWDFAKQWDLKDSQTDFRTSFYIGSRF